MDSKRLVDKVLLIGWGSADMHVIDQLIKEEKLPNVKKLLEKGSRAVLNNFDPPLFSASWTSLTTGKVPGKHKISSFTEISDNEILPVSVNSRAVKALWNILSGQNKKVHQIGACVSHPAEKINGISISDWYINSTKTNLADQAIHPLDKKQVFTDLLVAPDEISEEELQVFLSGQKIDSEEYENAKKSVKHFIAGTKSIQAAASYIIESQEWDQVSIFFNQLSNVVHGFMEFHISDVADDALGLRAALKNVVTKAYERLDEYLGEMLTKIGDNTAVFLVSQSGFLPDATWINNLNKPYSTWEYNSPGVCIWNHPKLSTKEELYGVNAIDVVPTILALLGLPFAKDFDGKIILSREVLSEMSDTIDTYEKLNETKVAADLGTGEIDLIKRQLIDINYLVDSKYQLEENQEYFRTRVDLGMGQVLESIPVLEDLLARYPDNSWYAGRLVGCLYGLNRPEEGQALLESLLAIGDEIPEFHLMKGKIYITERKFRSAAKEFEIAERNIGKMAGFYQQIGDGYLQMNDWRKGVEYMEKEVAVNPNPHVYLTMGMVLIQNKMMGKAMKPLQKASELAPLHPIVHFHLGSAYYNIQEYEKAAEAYETAKVFMRDPKMMGQIQQALVKIYRDHLKRPEKIEEMKAAYERSIGMNGNITVVSGLPRSGTSMMMQMLVKGGLVAFTDGKREADENNQKGYYEHEAVKRLAREKKFLKDVGDRVVKIISHLIMHLPHVYKYKIIFMDREIEEVMYSQHKMLGRLGKERGKDKENSLRLLQPFKESRQKAIMWCKNNPKYVDLLLIPYQEAINNPLEQAKRVNEFLGNTLDVNAMASVVDASLYRERTESIETK